MSGKIIAVCKSSVKGVKKKNVREGCIEENYGIKGDAHSGNWHRQVSLLSMESIRKMRDRGVEVSFGDFGENLTTEGIDLIKLKIKDRIKIGEKIILEITQIGKECEEPCSIYYQVGDCIMPREGIFAKVVKGGKVKVGDKIEVVND